MLKTKSVLELLTKSEIILNNNYRENYTIPSSNLYPHQWSWDSCWIIFAYANIGWHEKAENELRSLFKYQWKNGLIPSIIFHDLSDNTYFPGPEYWNLKEKAKEIAVKDTCTGIVQPPIHSHACLEIFYANKNKLFLEEMYPKLLKWHEYLYNYRDLDNEGIVFIRHPWESGMDNSPNWDEALSRIQINKFKYSKLRTDNKKVNDDERPTDLTYERYLFLIELFKKCNYNEATIVENSEFIIQDVLFNVLLIKSNYALLEIGKILQKDISKIELWIELAEKNFKKFFINNFYYNFDLKKKTHIFKKTISGISPIFLNLNPELIIKELKTNFLDIENNNYKISTLARSDNQFNSINYWRGPMWINLSWLILSSLEKFDKTLSMNIKKDCIKVIKNKGFYEYFDSLPNGNGCGDNKFSWTAAICICLINNMKLF